MKTETPDPNNQPIQLVDVLIDELRTLRPKTVAPDKNFDKVFRAFHKENLAAICFSGGGIRSATFGLGIIQALAKHKLLTGFDYLSTVSGGGYLGSWLSAWIYRAAPPDKVTGQKKRATDGSEKSVREMDLGTHRVQNALDSPPMNGDNNPNPESTQLQHLREFSNYMSPRTGLFSTDTWTLVAIYLRNLLLNLTIFIPLMAAVLILPRLLFRSIGQNFLGDDAQSNLPLIAMVAFVVAIGFVMVRLPSMSKKSSEQGPTEKK